MQKHVNLVDLVKSFPTNIFLQNLASIQKRTSPLKFAHLAEKSEKNSISNLSTKVRAAAAAAAARAQGGYFFPVAIGCQSVEGSHGLPASDPSIGAGVHLGSELGARQSPVPSPLFFVFERGWQNFGKMFFVFGCIGTDFCNKICVLQHFSKSTRFSS